MQIADEADFDQAHKVLDLYEYYFTTNAKVETLVDAGIPLVLGKFSVDPEEVTYEVAEMLKHTQLPKVKSITPDMYQNTFAGSIYDQQALDSAFEMAKLFKGHTDRYEGKKLSERIIGYAYAKGNRKGEEDWQNLGLARIVWHSRAKAYADPGTPDPTGDDWFSWACATAEQKVDQLTKTLAGVAAVNKGNNKTITKAKAKGYYRYVTKIGDKKTGEYKGGSGLMNLSGNLDAAQMPSYAGEYHGPDKRAMTTWAAATHEGFTDAATFQGTAEAMPRADHPLGEDNSDSIMERSLFRYRRSGGEEGPTLAAVSDFSWSSDPSDSQTRALSSSLGLKGGDIANPEVLMPSANTTLGECFTLFQQHEWKDRYHKGGSISDSSDSMLYVTIPDSLHVSSASSDTVLPKNTNVQGRTPIDWLMEAGADLMSNMFDIKFLLSSASTSSDLTEPVYLSKDKNGRKSPWTTQCFVVRTAKITIPQAISKTVQFDFLQRAVEKIEPMVEKNHFSSLLVRLDQDLFALEFVEQLAGRTSFYKDSLVSDPTLRIGTKTKMRIQVGAPQSMLDWVNAAGTKTNCRLDMVVNLSSIAPMDVNKVDGNGTSHSVVKSGTTRQFVFENVKFLGTKNSVDLSNSSSGPLEASFDFTFSRSYMQGVS